MIKLVKNTKVKDTYKEEFINKQTKNGFDFNLVFILVRTCNVKKMPYLSYQLLKLITIYSKSLNI